MGQPSTSRSLHLRGEPWDRTGGEWRSHRLRWSRCGRRSLNPGVISEARRPEEETAFWEPNALCVVAGCKLTH